MHHPRAMVGCVVGALAASAAAGPGFGASGAFLLIRRDHQVQPVELVEINDRTLVHTDAAGAWVSVALEKCVALLEPDAVAAGADKGLLRLADGQRFPGEALSGARPADDVFVWNHASLGRMEVPLDRIESVVFARGAAVPAPGDADVLLLANGDRLEGFVTALGDPISIEVHDDAVVGGKQIVEIALGQAAAVSLVAPPRRPAGRRLWLTDGTVVDVAGIMLGDDGIVRLVGLPFLSDRQPKRLPLSSVAAVLFDHDGLLPFAALSPARIDGPAARYIVPRPKVLDDLAPLGLSRVEFRGPITVHYALPVGPVHFSADARLPLAARSWGDCEFVIRDDEREVFRVRLNGGRPAAAIGVTVRGSVLTIEISEGANGPIQDHVILHRAMLLPAQP